MTGIITLTTAGIMTGPFNIYSNIDGFLSAFDVNITRDQLLAGYPTDNIPDGTTTIRISSVGACYNYIDLVIPPATTTTTTSSSTTTTTTTIASFIIKSTVKDVDGAGLLEILGGVPGETIDLSFVMSFSPGDFNSLNFSLPVTVSVLDPLHDTRTGTMLLDGSGNGSSIYDFDPTYSGASCLVTVTARSSGNPIGIGDDTNII